jgi:hypothetical protein
MIRQIYCWLLHYRSFASLTAELDAANREIATQDEALHQADARIHALEAALRSTILRVRHFSYVRKAAVVIHAPLSNHGVAEACRICDTLATQPSIPPEQAMPKGTPKA